MVDVRLHSRRGVLIEDLKMNDIEQHQHLQSLGWTPAEAAKALGVAQISLARDRASGRLGGIPFVRVGGRIIYLREQVLAWLVEHSQRGSNKPRPAPSDPATATVPKRGRGRPRKAARLGGAT